MSALLLVLSFSGYILCLIAVAVCAVELFVVCLGELGWEVTGEVGSPACNFANAASNSFLAASASNILATPGFDLPVISSTHLSHTLNNEYTSTEQNTMQQTIR